MENSRLIENFIEYLRSVKRYSPHTCTSYTRDLNQFDDFLKLAYGGILLVEVQQDMVRSYIVWMMDHQFSPSSIHRKIVTLRTFYKKLIRDGKMGSNPASGVPLPRIPQRLPVFVPEEKMEEGVKKNLLTRDEEYERQRDAAIVELLYATGMRLSELTGLTVSNIDLTQGYVRVFGKRSKERIIPLGKELIEVMGQYLEVCGRYFGSPRLTDPLFRTRAGKKIYPMLVYRLINAYLSQLTTMDKKSPHVLRHSFATHLLNAGAEINAIKELLGHSSLASTQVYTHTSFEHLKEVYQKNHPKSKPH
ncbi:MAG: tyrosine-type recombinase/integrase [Bacteroidales bacterium]